MAKNKRVTSQTEPSKASKNNKNNNNIVNDKKDLNRLIKVLRPKVYITDSASFKTLVQELTGKKSSSSSATTSLSTNIPEKFQERRSTEEVLDIDPESSFESSFEAVTDSSCEFLDQSCFDDQVCEFNFNQLYDEIGLEDINLGSIQASQSDLDMFACWDVESLLHLETTNPYNFCGDFDQFQDFTVYDYELFGLL